MLALRIIWGGFFGFAALGAIQLGLFLAATLSLVASLLALPQTWRLLAERGVALSDAKKATLSFVFGLIALVVLGDSLQNTPNEKIQPIEKKRVVGKEARNEDSCEEAGRQYADKTLQQIWIIKSQEAIQRRLKDPDSAEFRNVEFYSGGSVPVACGEVNAKNGFGGYTGFERFIASGTKLAILASDMQSPTEMQNIWVKMCVKAEADGAK